MGLFRRCPQCDSLMLAEVLVMWPSGWFVRKLVCRPFGHFIEIKGTQRPLS